VNKQYVACKKAMREGRIPYINQNGTFSSIRQDKNTKES
jgi:hypothetical protein